MSVRILASVATGLVVATLLLALAEAGLAFLWPAYAIAASTKDYSLEILFVRLAAGAAIVVFAAFLASATGGRNSKLGWILGSIFLALSIPIHVIQWLDFPVWYHLLYLGYLVPLGALGGRMASNRSN